MTRPGQEVFGLDLPSEDDRDDAGPLEDDDLEDAEQGGLSAREKRQLAKGDKKQKLAELRKVKGRYGKTSDDEQDDDDGSAATSEDDDENWGRSYYSRPSTRRARDDAGDVDAEEAERKEEERELEEQEAKRIQRRTREHVGSRAEDWGLDDVLDGVSGETTAAPKRGKKQRAASAKDASHPGADKDTMSEDVTEAQEGASSQILLDRMALRDPLKLALAREWPLVVRKLRKSQRGIRRMLGLPASADEPTDASTNGAATGGPGKEALALMGPGARLISDDLHHGLGWAHYHTLLTYATTLAFYLHLASLPADVPADEGGRPRNLAKHPVVTRLLQLKQGLAALEDLDFDAASKSSEDVLELFDKDALDADEEDDDEEIAQARAQLMMKMLRGAEEQRDGDDEPLDLMHGEEDDSWMDEDLEDGELEALKAELGDENEGEGEGEDEQEGSEEDDEADDSALESGSEEDSAVADPNDSSYALLAEPEFVPAKKSARRKAPQGFAADDDLGDPTYLNEADSADKTAKKRSLRFHTSKIAATSARRAAARSARMGGDDDVPYRNKQAVRDAALKKSGPEAVGAEDLDVGEEWTETAKKRVRDVDEDDDGYYDLVKRRRTQEKEAKQQAYDDQVAADK